MPVCRATSMHVKGAQVVKVILETSTTTCGSQKMQCPVMLYILHMHEDIILTSIHGSAQNNMLKALRCRAISTEFVWETPDLDGRCLVVTAFHQFQSHVHGGDTVHEGCK